MTPASLSNINHTIAWSGFIAIFILSLAIRLVCTSIPGFGPDISTNASWALSGARVGLGESYRHGPDHPPMSIIAYTIVGKMYYQFMSDKPDVERIAASSLLKMPAILADILTIALLFIFILRWKGPLFAIAGSLMYALNPAVILDSAVWGQIDSVFTLFLVGAIVSLAWNFDSLAILCFAVAILSKAQSVALAPFFLLVWLHFSWRSKISSIVCSLALVIIILFPFLEQGTLQQVWSTYTTAIGRYSSLSMNAFNVWWILYPKDTGMASTTTVIPFITFRHIGFILFGLCVAYAFALFVRARFQWRDPLVLFGTTSCIVFSFFMFNTEMHERYLFPFLALALPMALENKKVAINYICISVFVSFNMLSVLSISLFDSWVFREFPNVRNVIALLEFLAFFLYLQQVHSLLQRNRMQHLGCSSTSGSLTNRQSKKISNSKAHSVHGRRK